MYFIVRVKISVSDKWLHCLRRVEFSSSMHKYVRVYICNMLHMHHLYTPRNTYAHPSGFIYFLSVYPIWYGYFIIFTNKYI